MTCPVCGTVAVPGARFCHNCGSALPAAATLPATERRVVTVLFGDLSEFTAWAEDVDPERVGAVTDRVLAALAGAVKTFGGHVDKLTGDGIMAVFGAPVAHEDDAERAVRAALSMQRAVRRVLDDERGGGAPLGLRVGLNTGAVVAGVQAAIEYTVIGDTVNTAARLADAAAVGAVYAGAATADGDPPRRLVAGAAPAAAQGQARAGRGVRTARPARRAGHPVGPRRRGAVRRAGAGAGLGRRAGSPRPSTRASRACWSSPARPGSARPGSPARWSGSPPATRSATGGYVVPAGARVLIVHCAAFGERRRLAPLADLVRAAIGLPADAATGRRRAQVEERLRRLGQRLDRERSGPGDRRGSPSSCCWPCWATATGRCRRRPALDG